MNERKGVPATPDFRQWAETMLAKVMAIAGVVMFESKEEHTPMLIVVPVGDKVRFLPLPRFGSVESKEMVATMMRRISDEPAVFKGVIFVCETWALDHSRVSKEEALAIVREGRSIADHPARGEALMVNMMGERMQLIAHVPVDRAEGRFGKPVMIDPMAPDSHFEGRFVYDRQVKH